MTMTAAWMFMLYIIMVEYAAGHRTRGDNCCKTLHTMKKVLANAGHCDVKHHDSHDYVAFSASLSREFVAKQDNVILHFDKVDTNYGDAYKEGIFKCPINGLYAFDVSILSLGNKIAQACIKLNGRVMRLIWAQGASRLPGSGSTSVVLQLKKRDRVWISTTTKIYAYFNGHRYNTFRGWLLHKT